MKFYRASERPGEVLVKFREGTEMKAIDAIQKEMKLETVEIVSKPNLYLMKILNGSSIEQIIENLNNYNEVEYSELNLIYSYD